MAKQIINVGSGSNDKTGDTLRTGAIKINSNFTELYNSNQSIFDRLIAGSHITLSKSGNLCTVSAVIPPYTLPVANTANLGGVKVDGSTIQINGNGVISAVFPTVTNITGNAGTVTNGVYTTGTYANPSWITELAYSKLSGTPNVYYVLPTATTTVLGGVKVDGSSIVIDESGVISTTSLTDIPGNAGTVTNGVYTTGSYDDPSWINTLSYSKITGTPMLYVLPIATTTDLGGVKVDGSTITIDANGVISSSGGGGGGSYTLPVASTSKLGGVKVDGSTITIDVDGVISSTGGSSGGVVALSRSVLSVTTSSIAAGETLNVTLSGYKSYVIYKVSTTSAVGGAWVRIYTDSASRTADASRLQTADPSTEGVIAEVITTSNLATVVIAPGVIGFNNELTPTSNIELAVTNTNGSASTFTIELTVLPLEN